VGAGTALDLVIEWNIKSFVKVTDMIGMDITGFLGASKVLIRWRYLEKIMSKNYCHLSQRSRFNL
jgi:hypothetical protein